MNPGPVLSHDSSATLPTNIIPTMNNQEYARILDPFLNRLDDDREIEFEDSHSAYESPIPQWRFLHAWNPFSDFLLA